MTELQEQSLLDSMRNAVVSARMEGLNVTFAMQEMIDAVIHGERSLSECVDQLLGNKGE